MKRLIHMRFHIHALVLGGLLLAWQAAATWGGTNRFILPAPTDVFAAFSGIIRDGRLLKHAAITWSEAIPGAIIGSGVAFVLGYFIAKSRTTETILSPYLVASQAVPVIAIAPLLSLWIPSTYWSRVLVAVLVVFFPILLNVVAGMRAISPDLYDVMQSLKATKWQIFRKLELPASLPIVLSGLRIGVTLSIIGTLVGEFIQPRNAGLGFMLVTARYQFKTALVFALIIALALMALTMYSLLLGLEKRLLRWQQSERPQNRMPHKRPIQPKRNKNRRYAGRYSALRKS